MKLVTLTADEHRAVGLPDGARAQRVLWRGLTRPTTELLLDASDRADLRDALDGSREVYLDATEHGIRVTPASSEPVADPQPGDVIVGQCVSARLVCAALDALPRGPVAIVWRRRFDPLTLHAVEGPPGMRDAFVMPVRCCSPSGFMGTPVPGCPCRDCTAGRRWGW